MNERNSAGPLMSGFLTAPLAWVAGRLSTAIKNEPDLLGALFEIGQARMHLIALALAHIKGDISQDVALILLRGPQKRALQISLGYRPAGLDRVLAHLPSKVLSLVNYRQLVTLLTDRVTAKFLNHCSAIDERIITGLHCLPMDLRRPAVLAMFNQVEGMEKFVEGLRCIAVRASIPFEVLARRIGALDQIGQVVAAVRQLAESLPLIDTLPPAIVGPYRRLDQIPEIRALAKSWQNCLADYTHIINDAACAVYRTDPPCQPAVCLVTRQWRLGWFLQQAKGPKNNDLQPEQLADTIAAFANAGIFVSSIIEAIKIMALTNEWSDR